MRWLNMILTLFDRAAYGLVALLMGGMGVIAFAAVFFRFVLSDPLTWSEEAARYMMVWVTFLGAGYASSWINFLRESAEGSPSPQRSSSWSFSPQ